MYELYLNRLIDDKENSKEYLQELRNNNQMVKFHWEDPSYPFKDKLIETAKKSYEENHINEIFTKVEILKKHWEKPWETMKCSEYNFKMRLGIKGIWLKWIKELPLKTMLVMLLGYTVFLFILCLFISIIMSSKNIFAFMTVMELWLLSSAVFLFIHPAFYENEEQSALYGTLFLLLYGWLINRFDLVVSLICILFLFTLLYLYKTKKEREKLADYQPFIKYYYEH